MDCGICYKNNLETFNVPCCSLSMCTICWEKACDQSRKCPQCRAFLNYQRKNHTCFYNVVSDVNDGKWIDLLIENIYSTEFKSKRTMKELCQWVKQKENNFKFESIFDTNNANYYISTLTTLKCITDDPDPRPPVFPYLYPFRTKINMSDGVCRIASTSIDKTLHDLIETTIKFSKDHCNIYILPALHEYINDSSKLYNDTNNCYICFGTVTITATDCELETNNAIVVNFDTVIIPK